MGCREPELRPNQVTAKIASWFIGFFFQWHRNERAWIIEFEKRSQDLGGWRDGPKGGCSEATCDRPYVCAQSLRSLGWVCVFLCPVGSAFRPVRWLSFLSLGQRCHTWFNNYPCHVTPILYTTTILIFKTDSIFLSRNELKICPCL